MFVDVPIRYKRVACQFRAVEVYAAHIYGGNLAVFVGGVVVNSFCRVAAGRIDSELVAVVYRAAAILLGNGPENVEEVCYTCLFAVTHNRVVEYKRRAYEP